MSGEQAEPDLGDEQIGEGLQETEPVAGEGAELEPEQQDPEYDFLEVEDPNAKFVKVTVDGEEQVVPLAEALQGYSRTADYTRKTQDLAAQRQEAEYALSLAQALERAPGLTIQALAQNAGMSVEDYLGLTPQQQLRAQQEANDDDDDSYSDPLERELAQERERLTRLEERLELQEAERRIMQAVDGLKSEYQIGDDEARNVARQAWEMGLGPEAFGMIYQSMAYKKLQAQAKAQAEAEVKKQQTRTQRQQAAAAASQVVGSGGSAASAGGAPPSTGNMSPREAILAAFEAEGLVD